jgi:hypothetical protein
LTSNIHFTHSISVVDTSLSGSNFIRRFKEGKQKFNMEDYNQYEWNQSNQQQQQQQQYQQQQQQQQQQAPPPPASQLFGLVIPGHDIRTNFEPADATGTKFTLTIPFPSPLSPSPSSLPSPLTLSNITDIVFFLLPNTQLPPNTGAMLYWSASPMKMLEENKINAAAAGAATCTSEFELLGALIPNNGQSSAIFRTGWSSHEPLHNLVQAVSMSSIQSSSLLSSSSSPTAPATPMLSSSSSSFITNSTTSISTMDGSNDNNIQHDHNNNNGINLTFGISIEPIENIQNLNMDTKQNNNNSNTSIGGTLGNGHGHGRGYGVENQTMNVAKHIAMDLFNYLQSFDDVGSNSSQSRGIMNVPTNVFDRWYKRFEGKLRRDPNFFMKSSS